MVLKEAILTRNPCYRAGEKITVRGLMLHSVGCAQPNAQVFVNAWNNPNYSAACVHGFIDGNDGTVYQTLPWDHLAWHCGGAANNTHIGVEMCEPGCISYTGGASFIASDIGAARACVQRTYEAAVELFAMLCVKFHLDPLEYGVILSHREGAIHGLASNHGDPEHLWNQLGMGYTMDGFRTAVKAAMRKFRDEPIVAVSENEKPIWDALYGLIGNSYGVAGLMGNLYAESTLKPDILQVNYEDILGYDSEEYTEAVNDGSYENFAADSAGYGLAQWTFESRKQALLDYAISEDKSIGDLEMQIQFLCKELSEDFPDLLETLRSAESVEEASTAVLLDFERPDDQSDAMQERRAAFSQFYFEKYGEAKTQQSEPDGEEESDSDTEPEPTEDMRDNTPAEWSKEAVEWMIGNGIMTGGDNGNLMLRSPITREQFCVMLKRYHDSFGG